MTDRKDNPPSPPPLVTNVLRKIDTWYGARQAVIAADRALKVATHDLAEAVEVLNKRGEK